MAERSHVCWSLRPYCLNQGCRSQTNPTDDTTDHFFQKTIQPVSFFIAELTCDPALYAALCRDKSVCTQPLHKRDTRQDRLGAVTLFDKFLRRLLV